MRPCPVCSSADTRFLTRAWDSEYCTTRELFEYARCAACEVIFLDQPPIDRLAQIYPKNYYSLAGGGTDSLAKRVKNWLDGRLFRRILARTPGDRLAVLDVGGGSGWLLTLIRQQNPRVAETHEVDLDEAARAPAEAAGHTFHCTRVEEFHCDRQFDLILLLNIIEHVADPGLVLRTLASRLAPGGFMLVKTPNIDTLDRRLFQHRNWGGFHCPRHWVLFNQRSFLDLARRCGLACESVRYTQGAPQWTNSILGCLSAAGWVSVTAERPMHTHPLHGPLLALTAMFDFVRLPFMKTAQMFVLLRRAGA